MPVRKCQTCKHYEPSPIRRKGWCRNPLLYSPQQSHLVGQDDLDCGRGIGNYWEPAESPNRSAARPSDDASEERPAPSFRLFSKEPQLAPAGAPAVGGMMASSTSGGGTGGGSRPPSSGGSSGNLPPRGGSGGSGGGGGTNPTFGGGNRPSRATAPAGQERYVSYQREEERYWTDYLRIALPIVGLLLLLGLFWFWANSLINNGDDNNGVSGAAATQTAEAAVVLNTAPVPTATAPAPATIAATETTQVAGSANPSATATQSTQTGQTQTQSEPTATTESASGENEEASSGTFQENEHVLVTDDMVNLRSSPSAVDSSNIVGQVNEGDELVITGPSEDSENYIWWPVQVAATGDNGYIVEQYIKKEGS